MPRPAILAALLGVAACANQPATRPSASPAVSSARESFSVYDLPDSWRDQRNEPRTLASLRGRPVVLGTIYTHCTSSCPLTLAEMQRVAAATDPRVTLVLVSLDPAHDTPERLAAFAREHGIDGPRWVLLTGTPDAVRNLTVILDVRVRPLPSNEFAHSNVVTLLDSKGEIVAQHAGFGGIDDILAAISHTR